MKHLYLMTTKCVSTRGKLQRASEKNPHLDLQHCDENTVCRTTHSKTRVLNSALKIGELARAQVALTLDR